jgi:hypothetical protein
MRHPPVEARPTDGGGSYPAELKTPGLLTSKGPPLANGVDRLMNGIRHRSRVFEVHIVAGRDEDLPAVGRKMGQLRLFLLSLLLQLRRGDVGVFISSVCPGENDERKLAQRGSARVGEP